MRYLRALGFPGKRIAGHYDVVDNNFFAESARRHRVATPHPGALAAPFFLYTGRLAPEKNVGSLIRAYRAYRQSGGSWPLVLVGAGPEEGALRGEARASGFSEDIHFEGLKSTGELPGYYASAGCFVLPSTREPWGLVVNEAMASGLPVIVSNRCGCAEDLVSHGQNGFLFDPANTGELAGCMLAISSLDALGRDAMARKSEEIIANFTPGQWAEEVASLRSAGTTSARSLRTVPSQ